jgi:hypothetical protein
VNQITGFRNLEESNVAVRGILTGTADLFMRGQSEVTGNCSVIRYYNETHFILFFLSVNDGRNYRFLRYFTSSLRSAETYTKFVSYFYFSPIK